MKKPFRILLSIFLCYTFISINPFSSFAQRGNFNLGVKNWINIGVKGGYGISFLNNKNIFQDDNIMPSYFTPSYFYGGKMGFNFNDYVGIMLEITPYTFGQEYKITPNRGYSDTCYNKLITGKSFDIPVLLRITTDKKTYVEAGIKFCKISGVTETNSSDYVLAGLNTNEQDVMTKFNKSYNSLIFGVGGAVVKGYSFDMTLGFRLNYALDDAITDPKFPFTNDPYRPSYEIGKTNIVSVQAVLEFNYYLCYFARSSCGRKSGFQFF